MPLGDSITAGVGLDANASPAPNYRLPLYDDLTAARASIQFEGVNNPTNNAQPGYCPALYDIGENQNNGFEGYVSGDIPANLAGSQAPEFFPVIPNQGGYWVTGGGGTGRSAVFPNIVTLMIGTNDAIYGVPLGSPTTAGPLEGNVTAILNWFATNRPATKVFVATPIPNENATVNAELVAYNSWLASVVPTYANDRSSTCSRSSRTAKAASTRTSCKPTESTRSPWATLIWLQQGLALSDDWKKKRRKTLQINSAALPEF